MVDDFEALFIVNKKSSLFNETLEQSNRSLNEDYNLFG